MADARSQPSPGPAIAGTAVTYAVMMGCGLITGLIASRSLGPSGRGELAAMIVWGSTLVYLAALGVPEAVAYYAASDADAEPGPVRGRVWATGQLAAVLLGVLATLAGWWLIPVIFGADRGAQTSAFRWFIVWFTVPSLGALCAVAWLRGAGRVRAFNVGRATVNGVNAAGVILLLAMGNHSVRAFAGAALVSAFAAWGVAAMLGPLRPALPAGASSLLARRMLHYGVRVQFGSWANAANVRLDQLLLSVLAPAASLGIYVVGVNYATLLLSIPFSAVSVMLPDVVRHHRSGEERVCLEMWYRRVLWCTVLAGAVLAPLAVVVIPFAFGTDFRGAIPIAMLLVPATALLGMNGVMSTAFQGIGRPEVGSKAEVVGLVATIGALGALLPHYGIYGAAVASALAYGSSHLYLMRKSVIIFGVHPKSLLLPTSDDVAALRHAVVAVGYRLTSGVSKSVRTVH